MYKHYQEAILKYYVDKRINGDLSLNLQKPSPSKIRDECAFIYKPNLNPQDLSTLMSFFEIKEGADVQKSIERFDIDRFRPVVKYMKGQTVDPEHKNLELLALLLKFPGRPYDEKKNYNIDDNNTPPYTLPPDGQTGMVTGKQQTTARDTRRHPLAFLSRRFNQNIYKRLNKGRVGLRVGGVAVLGLITAIYFNNKRLSYGGVILDSRQCMTWTGDRFQQISCDSNIGRAIKEPLDKKRLKNLQRITKPDTLRKEHIKNVWYRKRDGRIDFYTDGGKDPVDPNALLRPLSEYMFNKYLGGKNLPLSGKIQ